MSRLFSSFTLLAILPIVGGCPDQGVQAFNANPEASITSHDEGDEVREGDDVTFFGVVSDPDHQTGSLLASWYIGSEKICASDVPNADGITSCEATIPAGGDEVILEVIDPGGAAGSASVSLTLIPSEDPAATIVQPLAGGAYYADQIIVFEGRVSDAEDEATELEVYWESSLEGELSIVVQPDASGLVSGSGYLSAGEHVLTLHVQDSTGGVGTDSVIIGVGQANTAPTCEITAPDSSTVGEQGDLVSFAALVGDADVEADILEVTWSSDKDGEIGQSTPNSDGTVTFSTSALSVDTHTITLQVADEQPLTCTSSITYKVGARPELTLSSPSSGEVFNDGEAIPFSAQVSDADDSATALTLSWESSLDGIFSTQGADSTGLAELSLSTLSTGDHALTLTVTDDDGFEASTTRAFTVNALPSAPTVSLTPDPATSADDLVATASGSTDPDTSGTVSYRYDWFESGVHTLASTSAVFPASDTTRGLSYRVVVTPNDGTGDGATGEAEVTIDNAAPVVATPVIAPSSGVSCTSTLSCSASASDADGDSASIRYAWTNDSSGTSLGSGAGIILASSSASSGDSVSCTATADDGYGGSGSASATVLVEDCGPSIASVSVSPDPAYAGDTLSCSYSGFSDPDGGSDASTYAWDIDGVAAGTSATLSGGFVRGDTVTCTVTPSDGTETGTPVSDGLVISNTAPELSDVSVSPSSGVTSDATLTCSATASDADSDTISTSYAWTNDSTSASLGSTASITLSSSTASDGDTITCSAIASDSYGGSDSGNASVLVSEGAPSISGVSVSPDPAYAADTISCAYSGFSDPEGDADLSTYAWAINGSSAGSSATLTGGFVGGDTVSCTVTPSDGVHSGVPVADSVVISNTAPVLDDVTLTPSPAWEGSTFTCSPGTAADDDGDSVSYAYAWDVEGVDPGISSATLSSAYFDRDETVTCTVSPSDGSDSGAAVMSNSVIVSNSAPSVASVSISPTSPTGADTLSCSYSGYSDPDGDSDGSSFAWTVDGSSAGSGSALASGFAGGDLVTCTVTPNDGSDDGSPVSASVTVGNTPPVVSSLALSPEDAYTVDTITAVISTSDVDGDSVSVSYAWTVDGVAVSETSSALSGVSDFDKGQVVAVTVTPSDGVISGTPVSDSLTVLDSPPTAPSLAILPHTPSVDSGDLLCTIETESTDDDGDSVAYSFAWTVDGEDYLAGGGADTGAGWLGATDSIYTGDTVPEEDLDSGQEWICEVTPDDGAGSGDVGSDSVVVAGSGMGIWPGASMSLADADWGLLGETAGDNAGFSVASAGDVDGDGLGDVLVGAYLNDDGAGDAGKVYLFLGASMAGGGTLDLSTADYTFIGEDSSDQAGFSADSAGDVDGDGLDDILIGAPYYGTSNYGRAYLIFAASLGSSSVIDLSGADCVFNGSDYANGPSYYTGWAVSSAGDFDGDGLADILIGAPYDEGYVSLFLASSLGGYSTRSLGDADHFFYGSIGGDGLGTSVASAGDVNGDGLDDILLGAPNAASNRGAAYLVLGGSSLSSDVFVSSSDDQTFLGETSGDLTGYSVSSAGDIDDDGLDDIIIGAPYNSSGGSYSGVAYIVLGRGLTLGGSSHTLSSTADYTLTGGASNDYTGHQVATAGDVDGDGLGDLLVGAQGNDDSASYAGKTYLILGASLPDIGGEIVESLGMLGEASSDQSGRSVASAGDVDGDGVDEIIVGAGWNDEGTSDAGKAYILELSTIQDNAHYVALTDTTMDLTGPNSAGQAGYAVSTAGDVDADGLDDFLVGAPGVDSGTGDTYLLLGASITDSDVSLSTADHIFEGIYSGDASGIALAGLGDVQGDGLDDFVIGASGRDDSGTDSGAVYLVYGDIYTSTTTSLSTADLVLRGEYANDNAGSSLASAGDVDGDGYMDLLVGAPYNDDAAGNTGKAYLVTGVDMITAGTSASLSIATHGFLGEGVNDLAGTSVASAGDVDGDGLPDLLIGATGDDDGGTNAGKAYLVLASTVAGLGSNPSLADADYYFTGEAASDGAGAALAGVGDVDGDGLDDFMVGASGNDDAGAEAGAAYLLLGSSLSTSMSLASADSIFTGAAEGDLLGHVVAGVGDVDFDGFGDALIGAPYHDMGGEDAGASYLLLGATLRAGTASYDLADTVFDYQFMGDTTSNYAGWAAGTAGDVNGDGYSDLLFGAYGYNGQYGRTYLALSPGE